MYRFVVAPYVGAWIETKSGGRITRNVMSHPTWVRGLKLTFQVVSKANPGSHPTWVRGLKHHLPSAIDTALASHPTWVRGLKQV